MAKKEKKSKYPEGYIGRPKSKEMKTISIFGIIEFNINRPKEPNPKIVQKKAVEFHAPTVKFWV